MAKGYHYHPNYVLFVLYIELIRSLIEYDKHPDYYEPHYRIVYISKILGIVYLTLNNDTVKLDKGEHGIFVKFTNLSNENP